MAIVKTLRKITLEGRGSHTEVDDCTYSVVTERDGRTSLQIDTYGSAHRQMPGKKSQSIRFSPEAIVELRRILSEEL